jgi:hypothetical protein
MTSFPCFLISKLFWQFRSTLMWDYPFLSLLAVGTQELIISFYKYFSDRTISQRHEWDFFHHLNFRSHPFFSWAITFIKEFLLALFSNAHFLVCFALGFFTASFDEETNFFVEIEFPVHCHLSLISLNFYINVGGRKKNSASRTLFSLFWIFRTRVGLSRWKIFAITNNDTDKTIIWGCLQVEKE